jgi:hypothetical protein
MATTSAAQRRQLRNAAIVDEHPRWHGVRHPELIAFPPRRFSRLDVLKAEERERARPRPRPEPAVPSAERRAVHNRAVVAAHPRWHGIAHPERIVFFETPDLDVALISYRSAIRRALVRLQKSEDLCMRIAAVAGALDHRTWSWATDPASAPTRPAPPPDFSGAAVPPPTRVKRTAARRPRFAGSGAPAPSH